MCFTASHVFRSGEHDEKETSKGNKRAFLRNVRKEERNKHTWGKEF
jgi:hypothetical protein